jgi:riboflavin-specific deaminase-like protein
MHLKLALSLDGKVACANGNSQWLSGPESLGYAHYLRQKYDAVLVGYRTVLADNPRLTVRPDVLAAYRSLDEGTPARNPVPVILDPRLQTLPRLARLHLWKAGGSFREQLPRAIYVAEKRYARTAGELPPGVVIIGLPKDRSGELKLGKLGRALARLGIRSVLVEGGARLAQEAIRQQAVDKVSLVITPKLIGRDGMGFAPLLGCHSVEHCLRLCRQQVEQLGNDVVFSGTLYWWDYHGSLARRSRKLRKQLKRAASKPHQ